VRNEGENSKISFFEGLDKSKKIAIFTHLTPDPDAIGSAIGLRWFLKKNYGIQSDVFYGGEISHPQNKTMLNVLSISLGKLDEYKTEMAGANPYNKVILVDCTEKNSGIEKVDAIIDHHRTKIKVEDYEYVNKEDVGSCCSIVWKIINDNDVEFDGSDEDKIVATAMLMGIKTDTNDLLSENTAELDNVAYQNLARNADISKISAILNYPLPKYLFDLELEALRPDNGKQVHSAFLTFLGILSPAKRDSLPILADKLIRIEGTSTSIIFCIIDDHIEASVRSKDVSLDVDAFCKKLFGKEFAGGKYGAGGARIPMGFFGLINEPEEVQKAISEAVRVKIISKIEKEITGNG